MKKYLLIFFILIFLNAIGLSVFAGTTNISPDVIIAVINKEEQYSERFNLVVQAKFNNTKLYNDNVYMSYHVLDNKDNLLFFEGQRLALVPISNDLYYSDFSIDLSAIKELDGLQNAKINFDLIDEKNVYWFSKNNEVDMHTDIVVYRKDAFKAFYTSLFKAVKTSPSVFLVNVIFLVLFIKIVILIRKRPSS